MAGRAFTSEPALRSMLRLAVEEWLDAERASLLVNSVENDGPELLAGLLWFSHWSGEPSPNLQGSCFDLLF